MKDKLPLYISIGSILLICLIAIGIFVFREHWSGARDNDDNAIAADQMDATIDELVFDLKKYDIAAMKQHLNSFPDKSQYVYLDDIFNDEPYQELYRMLYPKITYKVLSHTENTASIEATMPNIQSLFTTIEMNAAMLALEDEEFKNILLQDETKSIELIQQAMLAAARKENGVPMMTEEFTLSFDWVGDRLVILSDDQLRAFITGNFVISKGERVEETQ